MDLGFISDDILLYSFRKCNHSSRFNIFHLLAQDIVQRIHEEHPRSYLWCNCMPSYWAETWRFGPKLRVSWAERSKYKWTKPKPSERMRTVKLQHFSHPLLLSREIFWLKSNWVHMSSTSRSTLPPPSPPAPSRSSQSTRSQRLSHASNLGRGSVSPLIVYMFRCCSLETSCPHLLPQSLKDCSINLCLFFCSAYRVIINIFLNSIYMC